MQENKFLKFKLTVKIDLVEVVYCLKLISFAIRYKCYAGGGITLLFLNIIDSYIIQSYDNIIQEFFLFNVTKGKLRLCFYAETIAHFCFKYEKLYKTDILQPSRCNGPLNNPELQTYTLMNCNHHGKEKQMQ